MRQFNKVAIIGVGLIGGSIGLAIKKRRAAREVTGVFRHRATLRKALVYKAVDKGTMDIREGIKDADLVILATPVLSIPVLAAQVIRYLKKGAIITDVGSTKKWIVKSVEDELKGRPSVHFVGSHPMAGSESAGVEFAKDYLLEGSPCIVTKTEKTGSLALEAVVRFWTSLGAKVKTMSPDEHDRCTAFISHLPHLVSFSLAGAVSKKDIPYAAEGFRDTTRVASSNPELWADIFLTNRKEILKSCLIYENYFREVKKAISKGDRPMLVRRLKFAKVRRDKFAYE